MNPNDSAVRDWRTKPTDRFILKWVKVRLSARITPHLLPCDRITPAMVTLASTAVGVFSGVLLALGWPFAGGVAAAVSQVLDGVDGQLARLRGTETRTGAFWDSVLDRYADGAMVMGLTVCLVRWPTAVPAWLAASAGALAIVGGSQISYSSARADSLGIDLGPPTLASKGTRVSVLALGCLLSPLTGWAPSLSLFYLAIHPNAVAVRRLMKSAEKSETGKPQEGCGQSKARNPKSETNSRSEGCNDPNTMTLRPAPCSRVQDSRADDT